MGLATAAAAGAGAAGFGVGDCGGAARSGTEASISQEKSNEERDIPLVPHEVAETDLQTRF
jgi:hypothetical protein